MTKARVVVDVRQQSSADHAFRLPSHFGTIGGKIQLALKRATDILVAVVALVLLSPLLAVVALSVWLDSGFPILYPWKVVGRHGRFFVGYKFRTMVAGAEALQSAMERQNEMRGPAFKMKNDPRVTSVGRFLRRYSLDELPQLWSVLKGDMSLVGPRPPLRAEWERFEAWQRRKLSVVPGMTCLWQVSGRADIRDFNEWARLDLEYIDHWSLWLDAVILCRTVLVVLVGKGAY